MDIPRWMKEEEAYTPKRDRDGFLTRSMLRLMGVLARAREDGRLGGGGMRPELRLLETLWMIVLVACAGNVFFSYCLLAVFLVRVCLLPAAHLARVLRGAFGASFFSAVLLLPAVFWGSPGAMVTISLKVFLSAGFLGLMSAVTPWNEMTGALSTFRIPGIVIFTLDMTLKYIVLLGELCLNTLEALRLRSVGRNRRKANSFSGILGTAFLRSGEMAQETYQAMVCRGFDGEYKSGRRGRGLGTRTVDKQDAIGREAASGQGEQVHGTEAVSVPEEPERKTAGGSASLRMADFIGVLWLIGVTVFFFYLGR